MSFTGRLITSGCIGLSCSIYAAWNYSERGVAYDAVEAVYGAVRSNSSSRSSHPPGMDPVQWRQMLTQKTIHHAGPGQERSAEAFVLSNFSHKHLVHLGFNMIAWRSFAQLFHHLPPRHYVALVAGSALSSSWMFEREHMNRPGAGLGASGIVSGLAMATTMIIPTSRVLMFGVLPAPLWMVTAGFFLMDTYYIQKGVDTGIGHSAHVGGALFGAVYYALFLRRYGGLLSAGRWR